MGTECVDLSLRQIFLFPLEQYAIFVEGLLPLSTARFFSHLGAIDDIGFVYKSSPIDVVCSDQFWVLGPPVQCHERDFVFKRGLSLYQVAAFEFANRLRFGRSFLWGEAGIASFFQDVLLIVPYGVLKLKLFGCITSADACV